MKIEYRKEGKKDEGDSPEAPCFSHPGGEPV